MAQNALELARGGVPQKPFYLAGQVGGQGFSVHAEGERLILTRPTSGREEIELAGPAAQAKGVRLTAEVDRAPESCWADPNRLRQTLVNLVLNAVKFTPEGGSVTVRLERREDQARVEVHDTGIGIAPDLLPFVFERFRQGDSNSSRSQGGLGLGLAIAQYIAEQHEGRIHGERSEAEHGR